MSTNGEARETYKLLVTRRNAEEVLLLASGKHLVLPRIEILRERRVAEQLTEESQKAWGLRAYCLFTTNLPPSERAEEACCAVMECAAGNEKAPEGLYWMTARAAEESCHPEDTGAVRSALAQVASYAREEQKAPFARPGWLRELFAWAGEQIAPLGLRLTGNFQQWNASPMFSLLRLETENGALWFKATGAPNAHELPVTLLLARLFPAYLPRIFGVRREWNGWLAGEAPGTPLDELTECSAWERAAEDLARLQMDSIGRSTELLEGQCKDLRLSGVESKIDPFLSRLREFMGVQEKISPAPLSARELASLGEGLRESIAVLQSFGLPDTLGHLDCNPGNLLVSAGRCTFLDWAEACVTHPFVTFEYLRRHMERCVVNEPGAEARLTAAYLRPWEACFSPEQLRRAAAAVPPIAVFLHAIGNDTWKTLDPAERPRLAAYFRSLGRRMYREAVLAAERSERCLS